MAELLPCPFCGSKNVEVLPREHYLVTKGVKFKEPLAIVECFNCYAAVGFFRIKHYGEDEAKRLAIEAWNRREDDG